MTTDPAEMILTLWVDRAQQRPTRLRQGSIEGFSNDVRGSRVRIHASC